MEGLYKIAEHTVKIVSLFEDVHNMCRDYSVSCGDPEFIISVSHADIEAEREKSENEDLLEGIPVRHFSAAYLETLAVYRKLAVSLLDDDIILFHGSCVCVDGEGYLFAAKSSTGKSTHTSLWREVFGNRAVMVNDDKPLLKIGENSVTAYGTPWCGKHNLGNNICVELKAVCLLERGEQNKIVRITAQEAYPMLFQQSFKPNDTVLMIKTLNLLDRLKKSVGLYKLTCNKNPQAATIAFEGMQE